MRQKIPVLPKVINPTQRRILKVLVLLISFAKMENNSSDLIYLPIFFLFCFSHSLLLLLLLFLFLSLFLLLLLFLLCLFLSLILLTSPSPYPHSLSLSLSLVRVLTMLWDSLSYFGVLRNSLDVISYLCNSRECDETLFGALWRFIRSYDCYGSSGSVREKKVF